MAGFSVRSMSGAARVHRVFHRIGVVLGGLFVLGAVVALCAGVYGTISGPRQVTEFSQVYSYPKPRLQGEVVVHENGITEPLWAYLAEENKKLAARHQTETSGIFGWSFGLLAVGLGIYAACRALGWIVAGAMNG